MYLANNNDPTQTVSVDIQAGPFYYLVMCLQTLDE